MEGIFNFVFPFFREVITKNGKAILKLASRLILGCIEFALLYSLNGKKKSRHSLDQKDSKLKKQSLLGHSRFNAPQEVYLFSFLSSW